MRILIHGINFHPEPIGTGKYTGEMANWLADNGHEVRVVTAPPFNPLWRVAPGYSSWRYRLEPGLGPQRLADDDQTTKTSRISIAIFRCPVWVPRKPRGVKRLLHLASFALTSCPIMLWQVTWRPDIVLVVEPTFFCALHSLVLGRLCRAKTWLHVQDFEVDAAFELGDFSSYWLKRIAFVLERRLLSSFDRVSAISDRMVDRLRQKGVAASRCVHFPNWVDTSKIFHTPGASSYRAELGISERTIVALYSGSMGKKQGLDLLSEAARKLSDRNDIRFVFCGEGPYGQTLFEDAGHLPNVSFLPCQPSNRLNDLLNLADIHLLPQRADVADLVMPSKLTGILASGRPVIATAHGGTQLATVVAGRGLVVPPGDVESLTAAIARLASDTALRQQLGVEARNYALRCLDVNKVLQQFEQGILSVCDKASMPLDGKPAYRKSAETQMLPVTATSLPERNSSSARNRGVVFSPSWGNPVLVGLKRAFDLTASVLLIILLSPILLILAIAVRLSSPGPTLYRWRVVGQAGCPFTGYKFRSMRADADNLRQELESRNEMTGPVFKLTNDPRITALGRWMRRYSLDELPQLFSVVTGDMSLVGPRPPLATEYARFTEYQKQKLSVKPGMTCLWQVKGRNEVKEFDQWVELDLEYIRRWSPKLDLWILAMTAVEVFAGSGK